MEKENYNEYFDFSDQSVLGFIKNNKNKSLLNDFRSEDSATFIRTYGTTANRDNIGHHTQAINQRQQVFFLVNNLKMMMKNLQAILMVLQELILIIKIITVSQKHIQCMHHCLDKLIKKIMVLI